MIQFASDTTRTKGDGEIDGQDYNFVSRSQFEEYVGNKRFVEHGEFDDSITAHRSTRSAQSSTLARSASSTFRIGQLIYREFSRVPITISRTGQGLTYSA